MKRSRIRIYWSRYSKRDKKTGTAYDKQSIVWPTEICGALVAAERPPRFLVAVARQYVLIANRRVGKQIGRAHV